MAENGGSLGMQFISDLFMSPRKSRWYQSEAGDRKELFLQLLQVPFLVSHHSNHHFPNPQFIALHERPEGSKFDSASTLDFRSSGSIFRTNLFRTNGPSNCPAPTLLPWPCLHCPGSPFSAFLRCTSCCYMFLCVHQVHSYRTASVYLYSWQWQQGNIL